MKKLVLLIFLTNIVFFSHSQTWKRDRIDIYIGLPVNHFFGDIGGTADKTNLMGLKDIRLNAIRAGISLGATYRLNQMLYVQGGANFGLLGASDKGSRNEGRNYAFSTFGTEINATAMLFVIPESEQNYYYSVMDLRGGLRHMNKPFSLYLFVGGGGFFYNVTPKLDLIESDRFNNSQKFTAVIPFGVGIKYKFFARTFLGVELGARYVLSDYLDGFSPSQSKHNDIYYTLNFKLIHRLPYDNFIRKIKSRLK